MLAAILLVSTGYLHYRYYNRDSISLIQSKLEKYLWDTEQEVIKLAADTRFLHILHNFYTAEALDDQTIKKTLELTEKPYTVFIYDQNRQLLFWSNDKTPRPNLQVFDFKSPYYVASQSIFRTVIQDVKLQDGTYTLLFCIPIRLGYRSHPYGHIDPNLTKDIQLSTTPGTPIRTGYGDPFIYLTNRDYNRLSTQEIGWLMVLYSLSFLMIAILIQQITNLIKEKIGVWQAVGFFLFTIAGLRLVSYLFDLSSHFVAIPLFDPAMTIPAFNQSLGNILINIILILWTTIFLIHTFNLSHFQNSGLFRRIGLSFSGYFLITAGVIALSLFCKRLIQGTQIDFNFESVFSLDQISILALVGIILTLFSLFIWSAKIISIIQQLKLSVRTRVLAASSAIVASIPIAFWIIPELPLLQFSIVVSILILLLDLFLEIRTPNFTWIALWLVVLSGFSSILMFKYNRDKDMAVRVHLATTLTEETDTIALNEINDLVRAMVDPLDQVTDHSDVKQVIESTFQNLSRSYLKTYYQLYFPETEELRFSKEIRFGNLLYYAKNDGLDHYLLGIGSESGRQVLTGFYKKKHNPYNPLPQFLPATNFKNIELLNQYDYAIYQNGRNIERSTPEYKMILDETLPLEGEFKMNFPSGRSELIYNNGKYVTIIGKKLTGLIKPVSLFSYLFVIIVVIIFILLIANTLFPYLPSEFNFTLSNQISLRNKIQISVLTLIILSFVIIGIVTVYYFRNTAEKNYLEKLSQTASSLQQEIQNILPDTGSFSVDSFFNQGITGLALKYNSHIQLYDENGLLISSSDAESVRAGLIKDRMDVLSLINLKRAGESIYIRENRSDPQDNPQTAFVNLVSGDSQLLGFAGLPVYPGSSKANTSVKDFMSTLLNVYVFLLLIAGAFALAVANSITRPMTVLGQKLKEFKLGKSNEPLEWKTNDELGLLIKEYNQLIVKLDESADLLALTEREVAWREMAKQVAHEIKNPLTPMRLSIQHLQHAMQNADPIESRQLVQRVGMTLIEQIDNLSRIAAEFSTFAKMPKPQYERIILNDLVASVHDLFKKRDDMDFNLYVPIDEIYVNADKSHLLRVLNNLIKNAIQAIPGSRRGVIDIRLEKNADRAIIQVCDNGKGIGRDMRDKVFYPNFTTKTSGTGLGLAISKNIVESFGGRIYFETEEGIGTRFYFELPLLKNIEAESYRQSLEI